jgi:hypothetical protein
MDDRSKQDLINIDNHYFIDSPNNKNQSYDFEDEFFICNGEDEKIVITKSVQTEIVKLIDHDTQTENDIISENIKLKSELQKLKNDYNILNNELKEIARLVAALAKVSDANPNIDKIKANLALLVNREIRKHNPIPFISESLFSYKKKDIKL